MSEEIGEDSRIDSDDDITYGRHSDVRQIIVVSTVVNSVSNCMSLFNVKSFLKKN